MIKKTLTYRDYNGNETVEDLYFHLSTMEAVRIQAELDLKDGEELDDYAIRIATEEKNLKAILQFIDLIVQRSYGVRSADGKRFDKSPKLIEDLLASPKYDALITDLLFTEGAAQEFASAVGMLEKKAPTKPKLSVVDLPNKLTTEEILEKLQTSPELLQQLLTEQQS